MKPILIMKTGSTMPDLAQRRGDFEDWMLAGLTIPHKNVIIINVQNGEVLPGPDQFAGVVITGSHDMVTDDHPWIKATETWLAKAAASSTPILGICFGHQLLANALGGKAADNPNGLEYGCVEVRLSEAATSDALFKGMPPVIHAQVSHKQSVTQLPPGAVHLAASNLDPNQAFRYGNHVWGVQFHPEFDADITRAYIKFASFGLRLRKQDPNALLAACRETPQAADVLLRFSELCK